MRLRSGLKSAAAASVEAATPTRPENASVSVVSAIRPMKTPTSRRGEDRVGERAADQPVDLIQPVLEDPDADADRYRGPTEDDEHPHRGGRGVGENGEQQADDADRAGDAQPLQLLAANAGR